MHIRIKNCARCGEHHVSVEFKLLSRPMAPPEAAPLVWTHFARCPSNGEPVMLAMTDEATPR